MNQYYPGYDIERLIEDGIFKPFVLRAASQVLNETRPDRHSVEILTTYAETNIPEKARLPLDELATVVALKLMDLDYKPL